jgi:hypothetical protein
MKPDTSFATKSGHFYLLTTLTSGRLTDRNGEQRSNEFSATPNHPATVRLSVESKVQVKQ